MGLVVVFTTTLIAWYEFNQHPGQVVAPLDKTFNDDYFCLMALNKQQIQWERIQRNPQNHWITGNSQAAANSFNHKAVNAMKSVRIVRQSASDTVLWQEDKYAQQQPQQSQLLKNLCWKNAM